MKYNPKVAETVAGFPGFQRLHPLQPDQTVQGALELIWRLERALCEITGFHGQPLFGPQPPGELRRIVLDISLAQEVLAWHPWTHLEDGLKETVAYMKGG